MNGDHIVLFPFIAKGHTVPLLHLATALADRGILVSLVTTPANGPFCRSSINHPNIRLLLLPFPSLPPLPAGVESTDTLPSPDLYPTFLRATALLRRPFNSLLLRLCISTSTVPPPLAVISDFFLGFTLPACEHLGIPRIVFHGMGAFSMAICKALWTHRPHENNPTSPFSIPGMPDRLRLTSEEVPDTVRMAGDDNNPVVQFLNEVGGSDVCSWGVLVNSFEELEQDYVAPFETFYRPGARAWLVGPLSLLPAPPPTAEEKSECLQWLNGKEAGLVVYVSFGTQAYVEDAQLDEVAHGLVAAGFEFLWVVRSSGWVAPPAAEKLGRIERGWVPQQDVLNHKAVGGFVSHCGWNSVLESVAAGVPILRWPMIAEQTVNAKLVVEELRMGVALKGKEREEVCEGVRELMRGEKGGEARERAAELKLAAASAVKEGGSSHGKLDELINELRRVQCDNRVKTSEVLGEGLELEGETIMVDPTTPDWEDGIQTPGIEMFSPLYCSNFFPCTISIDPPDCRSRLLVQGFAPTDRRSWLRHWI